MATLDTKLGRDYRLYVGSTAEPENDAGYTKVANENEISFSAKVKTTEIEAKENGGQIVTLPGAIQYELKAELARIYTDAGFALVAGALGTVHAFQIRYNDDGTEKVYIEGAFLVTDSDEKMGAGGAATMNVTLSGAGTVIRNTTPRALATS